jgi:hypothetical protein
MHGVDRSIIAVIGRVWMVGWGIIVLIMAVIKVQNKLHEHIE